MGLTSPFPCLAPIGSAADPILPLDLGLLAEFPAHQALDFYSIATPADSRDCIHVGDEGQRKRAEEAYAKLSR